MSTTPTDPALPLTEADKRLDEATAVFQAGDIARAELLATEILAATPDHALTLNLLAAIKIRQNDPGTAKVLSDQATTIAPDNPIVLNGRAFVMLSAGDATGALAAADAALNADKTAVMAHNSRGLALQALGRLKGARNAFAAAAKLAPKLSLPISNQAIVAAETGDYRTAMKLAEQAYHLEPSNPQLASKCAAMSLYTPGQSPADERRLAEACWSARPQPSRIQLRNVDASPERQLTVGYLSSDIRNHPVSYFLKPVLEQHDRHQFRVNLYDSTPNPDALTKIMHGLADNAVDAAKLNDDQLAQRIFEDRVDILIDLSGLTDHNRLEMMRQRPAPVQATWIGYSGTTGCDAIDYIIADKHVAPETANSAFTETVIRLPQHYLAYAAIDLPAWPSAPPSQRAGHITFGSFNELKKINTDVVRVWASLLQRIPSARLFLKTGQLDTAVARERITSQFVEWGIDPKRLILRGRTEMAQHFLAYNEVDIALDPFPYCGTTTSFDALWMSVPTITLRGDRWVQRTTAGFLETLGLNDLITETENGYIETAINLAKDRSRLTALRSGLRGRMESSSLMDCASLRQAIERAYRDIWQRWCTESAS